MAASCHNEVTRKDRTAMYTQWEHDFIFLKLPITTAKDVIEFVKQNKFAVYTHSYDKNGVIECTYKPPKAMAISCPRIHLLLVNNHWLPITKLGCLYRKLSAAFF